MRLLTLGFLAASLLVASSASAAEGKGETGGKGGTGPGAGGAGPAGGSGGAVSEQERFTNPDYALQGPEAYKRWEVFGSIEAHRLIRQEDLGGPDAQSDQGATGNAKYQVFNYLLLGGHYDLTEANDRIGAYGGLYQFFLADPGESGYRGDDIVVYYTHYFYMKDDLTFRVRPSFTIPISWQSQRESNITDARLTLGAEKVMFGYLSIDARVFGDSFIDHYTTIQDGASANTKWRLAGILEAELAMPFHHQLSIGADVTDEYLWYYNPGSVPNPQMSTPQQYGAVSDTQFPGGQPVQQEYGGEVYVRYLLPSVGGVHSDILVALANGDPTLGYVGANHDGVTHVYLGYRQEAEVYAAFTARY
jgi:hypothetical protein